MYTMIHCFNVIVKYNCERLYIGPASVPFSCVKVCKNNFVPVNPLIVVL